MREHKDCRTMLDSLSDYIDGTLRPEFCEEIERHMAGCEDCQIVVDTLRKTVSLYRTSAPPADLPDEVRERLYHRLDLDEFLS